MKKSNRQIKLEATKKEHARVFNNYNLPCKNIVAHCADGTWIKKACILGNLEWKKWEKVS